MFTYLVIRLNRQRILNYFNKIMKYNSINMNLVCCIERVINNI